MVRNCAVCGGTEREVLHSQEFYLPEGHPLASGYDVVACSDCGFVFADTVVEQAAYDQFYAKRSKYEDSKNSTGSGLNEWDAARLRTVADAIAQQIDGGNPRILDLGCANGGLLAAFKSKGFLDLTGVDPSETCAAATREVHQINAVAASLYALPDLGLFDVITLSHVLEHLEDLRGAARNFARLLRPGGMVYIEVPDAGRYSDYLIAPFQDFNTEHINHFSHRSLRRLMSTVGLVPFLESIKTIESAKGVPYPALYGFYGVGKPEAEPGKDDELVGQIRSYIEKSQAMLQKMDDTIAQAIAKNPRVVVWGTGQLTSKLLKKTSLAEADIVSFIDSNPIHHGEVWMGKPVVAPQAVDATASLLIATTIHQDDIVAAIGRMGLENELVLLR
ncbi:MAG TPA: class I SAM-dependent methyltransferase [Bryobacteraceae bacterium]|jgi:SAM-dependent methyltransferase|nr:class I SAM-dependent methyltransferase [Bryobacteraceae bacterium]